MEKPESTYEPKSEKSINLFDQITSEIKENGGISGFIRIAVERHRTLDESDPLSIEALQYYPNLLQLERLASTIAMPNNSLQSPAGFQRANGFYWGEIIGMEIGDRLFGPSWSIVLFHRLNAFYKANERMAENEAKTPMLEPLAYISDWDGIDRPMVISNSMLGMLEDEEEITPIPEPYESLGRKLADELTTDEEVRHYIYYGYKLVINTMVAEAHYLERVKRDNEIIQTLSDETDWDQEDPSNKP